MPHTTVVQAVAVTQDGGLGGLSGFVADVVERLGEVGIGVLTALETLLPPLPSEVVLPIGGYLSERGGLDAGWVLVAAVAGALVAAWILYWLGASLGEERSSAMLSRLPLVDSEDVVKAVGWFDRHGWWAVLVGRLLPGVKSFVSVPAGIARMNIALFTLLTLIGSLVWYSILISFGKALATQWRTVEEHDRVLDSLLVTALVGGLAWFSVRRVRRRRAAQQVAQQVAQ